VTRALRFIGTVLLVSALVASSLLCAGAVFLGARSGWLTDKFIVRTGASYARGRSTKFVLVDSYRGSISLTALRKNIPRISTDKGLGLGLVVPGSRSISTRAMTEQESAEFESQTGRGYAATPVLQWQTSEPAPVRWRWWPNLDGGEGYLINCPEHPGSYRELGISVPHWMVAAVTGSPAAMWLALRLRTWRRGRRTRAGACAHCGYDLRATPDRCPECGTASVAEAPLTVASPIATS
jgi:hypothetical protein